MHAIAPKKKVTAQSLHGEDAPDAVVKEKTGGKYTSCAHVAAQGLCGHELAQMGCAKSCKNTKVKALAEDSIAQYTGSGKAFEVAPAVHHLGP